MDLCFSLKCTKNRDDDYQTRGGNFYTIPNYVTDDYVLSCHTNNFNSLINLKNNGNRHYKSYKFQQAVQCYTKALSSFTQEKNINNSKINGSDSFDLSNIAVNTTINEIDQNKVNSVVNGHKKNSQSVPLMSSSIVSVPSHVTSPLATSSNINIVSNSKNNSNIKQFPVSETSSYKIHKKRSDDEYSNAIEKFFEDNNRMEASFRSASQKSDVNAYQNQSSNQNIDVHRRKSKNKNHRRKSKSKSNRQPIYTPHPKVKSNDVMILYSTLLANRSASYIRLKDFSKANADAEHIIEIRPNWIKGYYRKAEALKGLKRYLESLDYYHQALKFNPSSEKILNAISTIEILLRNEELGIKIYQLVPGYDICVKKSIFKPIQYILFSYALQMQNYIYILADVKTKQCLLIDACWDIDGILEYVHKEKLKVIGAIYTHFHIDHTGGIPPPPYNKYMVKVEGMVKLSKIYPNIPFFIGPRDIDFVLKQNPDFNKNRFVPIEDRQVLTLDDIINLNKSKVKRRSHINDKIRTNSPEKESTSKQHIFTDDEGKDDELSPIKNEILSDDDAIIEKENFNSALSDKNSTNIEGHYKHNSKLFNPVKGLGMTDYKTKHLSNLNDDPIIIPEDNNTEVYSNYNLNEDSVNGFNNATSETSAIENSNMGNISNICYDGENSLKFYSNISEHDGNNNADNKVKIPLPGSFGAPITSTLERPKCKSIAEDKSYPVSEINKYGRINDTISTISMINIDKKDYSSNALDKTSHKIDDFRIQFIFTPGHTLGSMCILVNDERLFSGDTLLIGTCGRIDLPESSPEEMYDSLMNVLSRLDDDIVVYPGHSYGGDEWTTIAQEKLFGSMYNHGSYDLWFYELTGCPKSPDGSVHPTSSTNENKNEIMAMVPVSPPSSPIKTNFEHHHEQHLTKKESKETTEKEKDVIPMVSEPIIEAADDEEKITEIRIGPAKRYDEKKGYFSNYEYFDMNNINSNNKYFKTTSSPSVTTLPISALTSLNSNTSNSSEATPLGSNIVVARRKTNSSSNKNNTVVFSKRKESLSNKPLLQKQQQLQLKLKQTNSHEQIQSSSQSSIQSPHPQYQPKTQQLQPQIPQPQTELQTESPEEIHDDKTSNMKFELDKDNFIPVENVLIKGINIKSNSTNAVVDVNPIESDEVSSISSSSTTSESLSITSSSDDVDHYTNNSIPPSNIIMSEVDDLKKSYSIKSSSNKIVPLENLKDELNNKPAMKQTLMVKPSVDGEKLEAPNGIVEEMSPAVCSYDHIITSSIKEQLNKSSELDESYDSENYEKNKNILSGLSQSSYATSSTNPNLPFDKNLIMTEVYQSAESGSSSLEDDSQDYANEPFPVKGEKIRKKKSFLNNVFKKRSFDRKHQKHQIMKTEE